jgi:hypothetical protein
MRAARYGGSVEFDGHFVTIRRKGLGRLTVGKGEKRIALASIAAIQLKPAGPVINGFIQFSLPGGQERRSAFGRQTADAVQDENSVVFTRRQQPQFEALRAEIETAIMARSSPQQVSSPAGALADQLAQLAQMRSAGLLSDREFDAAKTRLLG